MATTKHKLEYALLRTIIFGMNLLPVRATLALSSLLGRIAWMLYPYRLPVAHHNLTAVFPEMKRRQIMQLLRRTYQQFARTFGLIFILHRKELRTLISEAEVHGLDLLHEALDQGKGVILTTYHGCWFEAYFAWFNSSGLPTSLIYQKQSNPLCDAFFVRQRNRYGSSLEHLHSQAGMRDFQKALEHKRILIVSLDQSYTHRGTSVTFFQKPLLCAKGTAVLHMRTQAPVLTSVYYLEGGKLHIDIGRVELPAYPDINDASIQDLTQRAISPYEAYIRRYPEQWFSLFHRLWSKKGYPAVKRTLGERFLA